MRRKVIKLAEERSLRELLRGSQITPNGSAYVKEHAHPSRRFHVVALGQHYSKEAIKLLQEVLLRVKPTHIVIEGVYSFFKVKPPEVDFLKAKAEELDVQFSDPIFSPYNRPIALAAGVSERDAIIGITISEVKRYSEDDDLVPDFLSSTFNLDVRAIQVLLGIAAEEIKADPTRVIKKYITLRNKLLALSNDLSWHNLQNWPIPSGEVLVLCGEGHEPIFAPSFVPARTFSDDEVISLERNVRMYESGAVRMNEPRGPVRSKLVLFPTQEELKHALQIALVNAIRDREFGVIKNCSTVLRVMEEDPGFFEAIQNLPANM